MSNSTTPTPTDDSSASDHHECLVLDPVTTTHTATHTATNVERSQNQEERVRFVVLPDRTILEDILVRYYGTSRDTLYQNDDDNDDDVDPTTHYEETCRVRYIY